MVKENKPELGHFPLNRTPAAVLGYLPFLDVLDLGGSFSRLSRKYGDVFSLKVGTETAVVLSSYDAIKSVLTDARFDSRPNTLMFKVRKAKGTQVHVWCMVAMRLSCSCLIAELKF